MKFIIAPHEVHQARILALRNKIPNYKHQIPNQELISNEAEIVLFSELNDENAQTFAAALGEKIPTLTQSSIKPASEVDLHIEKLVNDHYTLRAEEKLRYQMRAFETHLEKAVSAGLKEVIYIHGVGNGILKAEIGRKLSTNIFVKHYEDARRDKYGYGATLVVLK